MKGPAGGQALALNLGIFGIQADLTNVYSLLSGSSLAETIRFKTRYSAMTRLGLGMSELRVKPRC